MRTSDSLWRDPRAVPWLMTAYFLLSFASGPVFYITISGHFGWVLTAFFAWRVSRGGRISRAVLMVGTALACLAAAWAVAFRFTPGELGVLAACVAQLAVLVSPTVFWRTRPVGWADGARRPVRPRPPGPRWLIVALACAAALSLTGTAVAAAAIIGRVDSYNSRTVDVRFGQPATATLTPGRYFLFVRCAYRGVRAAAARLSRGAGLEAAVASGASYGCAMVSGRCQ